MKKPEPLKPDQLQHPKGKRSKFNGDVRRPASSQGFMARRASAGVSTTYANKPSPTVREVPLASLKDPSGTDLTGRRIPTEHQYHPAFREK